MMGFAVIVGEVIASSAISARAAFYGFMAGFFLLASSMVLNDYFDLEIDAINAPDRPLPSGVISSTEAVSFALLLASIGLFSSAHTGIWTLIIASVSLLIAFAYNSKFKKVGLLGNSMVSINVAVPFVYGGFAVVDRNLSSLLIFTLLAFLSSLGREVVKGIVDVPGDNVRGVRSIAVMKGSGYAAKQGAFFFLLAVALSVLPLILRIVSSYYLPLVAICDVGFLLISYSIVTTPTPQNAKRNKKYALIWMSFGLLAFVVGTV
jgi:geranylgeranylglycerol-phosphate geranylgeranyltransferase